MHYELIYKINEKRKFDAGISLLWAEFFITINIYLFIFVAISSYELYEGINTLIMW